jgi:hypothetical protein
MNRNEPIPPNWLAVRIDESEYCDPEFLARCGGKVYGVYLVDTNSVTYCCSPERTYCLTLVDTVCEDTPDDPNESDRLMTELMECTQESPDVMYVNLSAVDNLPDENKAQQPLPEDWSEDGENRGFEDVREAYCGSPDF